MSKKRLFSKSGQITIFIIIGILLLFAFIFIISLTSNVKKTQLGSEQERVISQAFRREAMRIYVEDCLQDELENGLILFGKQGRIWADQPGGTRTFTEGITGVTLGENRLFYGIRSPSYSTYQNAYPCNNDTNAPEFCQYIQGDTLVRFGRLELRRGTLEEDLRNYLANQTIACIENFTKNNISREAVLLPANLDLTLEFLDEGISVKANYPLRFKIGNEEFFQLSTFDFFYPTKFEQLLRAAVITPLENDYRDLNFNYTSSVLESPSYAQSELYRTLNVRMENFSLSHGDNVFTFTPPPYTVLNTPYLYSFSIARQNRPPALDYVNREPCPNAGYDYLVIKNDNTSLGEINISLAAGDPDEDNFSFSFLDISDKFNPHSNQPQNNFYVGRGVLSGLTAKFYNLTAKAIDEHDSEDWQIVRVLVDRPIETNVSLQLPYSDVLSTYNNKYIASKEDPVFINVSYPGQSQAGFASVASLVYNGTFGNPESFGPIALAISSDAAATCLSFPWNGANTRCSVADYSSNFISSYDLKDWPTLFTDLTYGHFKINGSGKLNISFSINYCGGFEQSASTSAEVNVVQCVPYKNAAHPYAYPYHQYTFGLNADGNTNFSNYLDNTVPINPLNATHSCCIGNLSNPGGWNVKSPAEVCFTNPVPGCYGRLSGYTTLYPGYVLEQEKRYCNGTRGNICNGARVWEIYEQNEQKLICGNNTNDRDQECRGEIPSICKGRLAFGIIEGQGWCHGTMGCQAYCDRNAGKALVNIWGNASIWLGQLNANAFERNITGDGGINYKCGCDVDINDYNKPCDSDFDGRFEGKCTNDGRCCPNGVCS